MDFSQLLNQVLGAAQKGGKAVADSPLNSFGGGALTGALASMLLKKKNTKKLVKAGSVAALGFLAYKGYQNWKQNRQQDELPQSAFQPAGLIGENHSRVILQTMIAAAASDGLIDDAERAAIERESGSDAETAAWLQAEYAQPASIEQNCRFSRQRRGFGSRNLSGGQIGLRGLVAQGNCVPEPFVPSFEFGRPAGRKLGKTARIGLSLI